MKNRESVTDTQHLAHSTIEPGGNTIASANPLVVVQYPSDIPLQGAAGRGTAKELIGDALQHWLREQAEDLVVSDNDVLGAYDPAEELWADWIARTVVPTYLDAIGDRKAAAWFRRLSPVTGQVLVSGSPLSWTPVVDGLSRRIQREVSETNDELSYADLVKARDGLACVGSFVGPSLVQAQVLYPGRIGSYLKDLVFAAAQLWWARNRWNRPEDFFHYTQQVIRPLRQVRAVWPAQGFSPAAGLTA